jgi:hypothetical protein
MQDQWRWSIGCITLTFIAFTIIPNVINFLLKIAIISCLESDCGDELLFTMTTFTALLPIVSTVSGFAFLLHTIPHIHYLQRLDPANPQMIPLGRSHWMNALMWMLQPILELCYQSKWDIWSLYHIFGTMIFFALYTVTFIDVVTKIRKLTPNQSLL